MLVRRTARPLATLSVSVVLVAGALAGCSDGQAEAPEPEPSSATSSPSESPPTEPVEPTLPAEAQGDDAAAAEAFVRHYYDYVNYAQATGDTKGLKRLGLSSCAACRGGTGFVTDTYAKGNSLEGGTYQPTELLARRTSSDGRATNFLVTGTVHHTRQKMLDSSGKVLRSQGQGTSEVTFQVVVAKDVWKVASWSLK